MWKLLYSMLSSFLTKIKVFDDVEKKKKDLEEKVKKLEEENSMLKKELSTVKREKECLNAKSFVCDISYDTNDLSDYTIKKCDFADAESIYEKCKNENFNIKCEVKGLGSTWFT